MFLQFPLRYPRRRQDVSERHVPVASVPKLVSYVAVSSATERHVVGVVPRGKLIT